jgi:aspartate kinase
MKERKVKIGGIMQRRDLAKIGIMSIPDQPGVAATIFGALGDRGINCPFIVHTIDLNAQDSIVLCVAREDLSLALDVIDQVKERVGAEGVVQDGQVGMVSVFGPHFGQKPGIAGAMFSALASAGINIMAISTSISSLCCLIDAERIDEAIAVLKAMFDQP